MRTTIGCGIGIINNGSRQRVEDNEHNIHCSCGRNGKVVSLDKISLEQYQEWVELVAPEYDAACLELSEPISDDLVTVEAQLRRAEALHSRMWAIKADADAYLDLAIQDASKALRGAEMTRDEKNREIDARVVNERRIRDRMAGIVESLKLRSTSCMSLSKEAKGIWSRR